MRLAAYFIPLHFSKTRTTADSFFQYLQRDDSKVARCQLLIINENETAGVIVGSACDADSQDHKVPFRVSSR